ncbi:hypothetical protein JCM16106_08940 [Hydrogenophilus islandicus]
MNRREKSPNRCLSVKNRCERSLKCRLPSLLHPQPRPNRLFTPQSGQSLQNHNKAPRRPNRLAAPPLPGRAPNRLAKLPLLERWRRMTHRAIDRPPPQAKPPKWTPRRSHLKLRLHFLPQPPRSPQRRSPPRSLLPPLPTNPSPSSAATARRPTTRRLRGGSGRRGRWLSW